VATRKPIAPTPIAIASLGSPAPVSGAGAPCAQPFPTGLSFPQLARDDLGKTTNAAAKAIAGKIRKVTFVI